ncbi:MAG TPA: ABC transporter permease subunit [Vicinamibacterales bacterium]|nr:ABC transporter permease subunit [Vicinamibacterales bacterium]
MSNILAIAHKELKSYFASPIAYIVIGLFALTFGFFFYSLLLYFDRTSMQMMGLGGPTSVNVNEQLIRPVFLNAMVVFLFILPMVTMRTYAEEKRTGTIELLLTAPLTDWQIILGKFLGAMALYAAMLAVTLVHIGLLFAFGQPDVLPILTTYLGVLLMGGCFIAVGLLISSMTKNQIVAATITFVVFLMLWIINWVASFTGPRTQEVLNYLSITEHLDDFTRGILDTKHLVYYVSFIAFGLFLTLRSVDSERWRG